MSLDHFVKKIKPINSLALIIVLTLSIIPIFEFPAASAAETPNITLKWTASVSGGGEALLTADVRADIPGEEVFHAGGPVQPSSTAGSVRCLNGRTGAQVWRTNIYGVGDTATMQMADVDLDGKLEIMVALQHPSGLYILNAEDGSILWNAPGVYNTHAGYFTRVGSSTTLGGRIDGSGVVGDTDGDGTPDIFIGIMAYEKQPTTGAIIHLEWNGNTFVERGRTQVWHPCAGGLSLGDTDNDGTPELYMNERDAFFGDGSWGRGTTAFNVWNGTHDVFDVRWRVYDWGASSDIPMLIDVNKDGVLDVVTTNLGRGIMVLNSSTGKPLQNEAGTTLKSTSLAMHAHYQSSIYDIDGDGSPELLCADGKESESFGTQVFDIWNWQLDADIPAGYSFRGPSIGEVTGDGVKDILVVTFDLATNTNTGTIQVYDKNYQKVFEYGNLKHRAIGSIVQDVDRNDGGLNEMLILTQGGTIYCFDTPGLSEENQGRPRARSEVHFYSESRLGASEYVPFERSVADIKTPSPTDGALGVSTTQATLSFNLNHPNNELMSYMVTADFGVSSASASNVGNGVKTVAVTGPLASNTLYHWQVSVTDASGDVTVKDYTFTTGPYTSNRAPTQSTPSLTGSTKVDDLVATAQGTSDLDGNPVVNIYNWQKGSTSIDNINLPFETQTKPQDEFSGVATTKDYAFNAIGAVFGATWVPNGKVGGAYSFDGNDFIRFTESSNRYDGGAAWNGISVESWVQPTGSSGRLIMKNNLYDSNSSYSLDCARTATGLTLTWRVGVPGNFAANMTRYSFGPVSVTTDVNAWHHVVATYKSGVGLRLYVDGVLVSSLLGPSYSGNIFNSDGPFEIAFSRSGAFQGLVDEVRLYPYEVSPAMISQRYQDTKDGLSASSAISKYDTIVGESWRCQVTPNDGLTDGVTANTASRTITAVTVAAPSVSNLAITPASPLTGDDLVAIYTYNAGTSGYPEYNSTIRWYKNGIYNFTNAFLPASFTAKGDVWSFRVIPSNGFTNGVEVTSGSVTIGNTAPSISGGVILPNPALDTSTLSAAPSGWVDSDGDTPGYTYQWQIKVGGVYTDISGMTGQSLTTAYFAPNDWIAVKVTPFDGVSSGATLTFETQIIDDQPPTAGTPTVTGTRNDDELVCLPGSTSDPDGDNVINIYNWLKGSGSGTSITNMYLPFETCSTTTASDYSGNGNDGSVSGATWTSQGVVGGAYQFDGNDAINVADSVTLGNDGTWTELTVEAWVYPATDQSRTVILNKNGGSASTNGKYMLGFRGGYGSIVPDVVYFGVYTAASAYEDPTFSQTYDNVATKIPVGSWSHVVGIYQAGIGLDLYINGVLASHASVTGSIQPSVGEQLTIGYSSPVAGTANRYFIGSLDEVKIYPTALSAAQVFQNYVDAKDGASDAATIVPQETVSGEVWRCSVTPNDGWQDGTTKTSNQVTITSTNTKPHIDWYSPADSTFYADIGVPIDFKQVSSDADNSPLSYSWTLDSVQQATSQNWTFTPNALGTYTVRVTVSDGSTTDYQQWTVNAGGTPPAKFTLHVQAVGGGSVSLPGDNLLNNGTVVQISATPNTGCSFTNWLLNGTDAGTTNPYQITVDNNYNLTAVFTPPPVQYKLHVEVSGQGTTNNTGDTLYNPGTIVSVQGTAASGWELTGWILNGSGPFDGNPYTLTMDDNYILTAVFDVEQTGTIILSDGFESGTTTLWTGNDGSTSVGTASAFAETYGLRCSLGSGANNGWAGVYKSISGNNPVTISADVRLNAPPNTDSEDQWVLAFTQSTGGSAVAYAGIRQVGGVNYWAIWYISTGSTLTYQVSNVPYTSGWHHLALTVNSGTGVGSVQFTVNGEIICLATGLDNDGRTLTYARAGFSYSDAPSAAASTVDIDNVEISSTTTPPIQYSLTVNTVGSGSVTKNPSQSSYTSGSSVQLTAVPAEGYQFNGWSGDLTGTTNPATLTMNGDKTVTATFTPIAPTYYTLTVNVVGSGSVTKNPNQASYLAGTDVVLTPEAQSGYQFSGWSGDLTGNANPATVTMNSDKTITATFTLISGPDVFDDFESGDLSAWAGSDGTTAASSAAAFSGAYGLSCSLSSGYNNGWSGVYTSVSGSNPVTLGADVQLNAPPDTDTEDQWVLAFTSGTAGNALAYAGIRQVGGVNYWAIWYYSGTTLVYQVSTTTPYSSGWHHLSLSIDSGAGDGYVQFSVDGSTVCSATGLDNDGRTLNYARVGFSYSDAPSATSTTVYIDNVTIE